MEICNVNTTGKEAYLEENRQVAEYILQQQFYKYFSIDTPREEKQRDLELIISPKCNLGCKYCYVHRFRDKLFDDDCFNEEKTIENLKLICEWMRHNRFNNDIDIFSGELLAQEVGYKVLETLADYYASVEPEMRASMITIPTNFTFICSEEATARVEEIRAKLSNLGIELALSASFDGKYMEQNRPYLHDLDIPLGGLREDEYYDKAFEYGAKTCSGFHPMVYSKGIELWPKNFDWFQAKFAEYGVPWECLYLLQVRNVEWNKKEIKGMQEFIRYLYAFAWEKVEHNPRALVDWVMKDSGFNMLSQPYARNGRGLTCGIQGQFALRVSDLMMYPCHRTGYKDFYYGQFIPDDKEVLKYVNMNTELLCATFAIHKEALPICAQCPINVLCNGTCLGSQYESTSNFLAPIPSVCALTHAMVIANMQTLKSYGAWGAILANTNEPNRQQLLSLERNLKL